MRRSVDAPKYDLERAKDALGRTEGESRAPEDTLETSGDGLETSGDGLEISGDGEETAKETGTVPLFSVEFADSTATALQSNITVLIRWLLRTSESR